MKIWISIETIAVKSIKLQGSFRPFALHTEVVTYHICPFLTIFRLITWLVLTKASSTLQKKVNIWHTGKWNRRLTQMANESNAHALEIAILFSRQGQFPFPLLGSMPKNLQCTWISRTSADWRSFLTSILTMKHPVLSLCRWQQH